MKNDRVRYVYISRRQEDARSAMGRNGLPRWLVSAKTVEGKLIESEHNDEQEMRKKVDALFAMGS